MTGVRSFLGLANKLSVFVPNFALMTVKLRELTAKKNAFLWLEEHRCEFEKGKRLLTSAMVVFNDVHKTSSSAVLTSYIKADT